MNLPKAGEQLTLIPTEATPNTDPDMIDVLERLDIMRREEGFLPTSRGELNEAFNLRTFQTGGTAKHLAEVAKHQVKHDTDPQTAAISKTRLYGGYGQRARTDLTALLTLQEELGDFEGANPISSIGTGRIHTGLGQYTRFVDLSKLAITKDSTLFTIMPLRGYDKNHRDAYDPYIDTHPSKEMQDHIKLVVGSSRVWEMRHGVEVAIGDQRKRFEFWRDRVQEIEKGQMGQTRAVARAVLEHMGVRGDA